MVLLIIGEEHKKKNIIKEKNILRKRKIDNLFLEGYIADPKRAIDSIERLSFLRVDKKEAEKSAEWLYGELKEQYAVRSIIGIEPNASLIGFPHYTVFHILYLFLKRYVFEWDSVHSYLNDIEGQEYFTKKIEGLFFKIKMFLDIIENKQEFKALFNEILERLELEEAKGFTEEYSNAREAVPLFFVSSSFSILAKLYEMKEDMDNKEIKNALDEHGMLIKNIALNIRKTMFDYRSVFFAKKIIEYLRKEPLLVKKSAAIMGAYHVELVKHILKDYGAEIEVIYLV